MTKKAYPLSWPHGWPRTPAPDMEAALRKLLAAIHDMHEHGETFTPRVSVAVYEAEKALRDEPAPDMARSLQVAIEHGYTENQWRRAKSIEMAIFGPYQWQDQGDRAASMFVRILEAQKEEAAEAKATLAAAPSLSTKPSEES